MNGSTESDPISDRNVDDENEVANRLRSDFEKQLHFSYSGVLAQISNVAEARHHLFPQRFYHYCDEVFLSRFSSRAQAMVPMNERHRKLRDLLGGHLEAFAVLQLLEGSDEHFEYFFEEAMVAYSAEEIMDRIVDRYEERSRNRFVRFKDRYIWSVRHRLRAWTDRSVSLLQGLSAKL
jgi:hypothetical protein